MSQTESKDIGYRWPPLRLTILMVLYVIASVSGILAKQGVLFCVLTLLMVLAVIGRQKTALLMLRAYTLMQLAMVSTLPFILQTPDNIKTGPTRFNIAGLQVDLPDYVVFAILIFICAIQVWIAFDRKVKRYFKPKMNMNIMN